MLIAGMGNGPTQSGSTQDEGIVVPGGAGSWVLERIGQVGNGFGGPAVLILGLETKVLHLGTPGADLIGCMAYTSATIPQSAIGFCATFQDDGLDGFNDDLYLTDGVQNQAGHPRGACYANCAAMIAFDAGATNSNLFLQNSDIDLLVNATGASFTGVRLDATSREALVVGTGTGQNTFSDVRITSPCTDQTLATAYGTGTATGCSALNVGGQANTFTGITYGTSAGQFGSSYNRKHRAGQSDGRIVDA